MRNTTAIAFKEFRSYLASPMAYIVTGIFLVLTGFFFSGSAATYSSTSIMGFLGAGTPFLLFGAGGLLLLLSTVLTMRLLAEERKMGTLELLLTAPVRDSEIIAGKFLGSLGILTAMLVLTFYYPLLLWMFGDPDMGAIVAGYLGLFLLGSASLAVGLFASSLTSNQIVAAGVAGGILFALWLLELVASPLLQSTSSLLQKIGQFIGYFPLSYYFPDFAGGIIDTRGIIYYLSIAALFLFLAIRSLENSRWS